jgi:hypothetical protein
MLIIMKIITQSFTFYQYPFKYEKIQPYELNNTPQNKKEPQ